jgi:hypothetical protein
MLAISMMILTTCAWAQTYEEAEVNEEIIDELMYNDFRLDAETNLWIFEGVEEADEYSYGDIKANYNLYYNIGHLTMDYYIMDEDGSNKRLAAVATADFKWNKKSEEFSMIAFNLTEYEDVETFIQMF